jgi:hypothetical protein
VTRELSDRERQEAFIVFGSGLDLDKPRVVEGVSWPNWPARLVAWLRRQPSPQSDNAITLGSRMNFPRPLRTAAADLAAGQIDDMAWLIHELTHVWQYQRMGPIYLVKAVWSHLHSGEEVYEYGGEPGLTTARAEGKSLDGFNLEQQGDIARDYYRRRSLGQDTSAWEVFVDEFDDQ